MNRPLRIAMITTEARGTYGPADAPLGFGTAPQALIDGFTMLPDVQHGSKQPPEVPHPVSSLSKPSFELHIISCNPVRVKQVVTRLAPHVTHHSVFVPNWAWLKTGYLGCIAGVRNLLKQLQPDIVHGQGTERDCAISAVFSGFPNVLTIHGNMAELARLQRAGIGSFYWLQACLENIAIPRTAGVFCNSAYTESLVTPRAKRCWRVPNAIRKEFFIRSKNQKTNSIPVILNVGVISPRKRQLEILRLARDLHISGAILEWHFIGALDMRSPYGREFKISIDQAELHGYAKFCGELGTDELIEKVDSADALVHFPYEEAFGLVVAEALSRGLKFFGSDLGGIRDICSDIETTYLIPDGNYGMLAASIREWLHSRTRQKDEKQMLAVKERYSPEFIAKKHLEIYREVLSKKRGS